MFSAEYNYFSFHYITTILFTLTGLLHGLTYAWVHA